MPINQTKKDIKSFKVELTAEEDAYVTEQAASQRISKRKYAKYKLLDTTMGIQELSDKIMRRMPEYYNLVRQVEDTRVRNALMELGGSLCRSLK